MIENKEVFDILQGKYIGNFPLDSLLVGKSGYDYREATQDEINSTLTPAINPFQAKIQNIINIYNSAPDSYQIVFFAAYNWGQNLINQIGESAIPRIIAAIQAVRVPADQGFAQIDIDHIEEIRTNIINVLEG